MARPPRFEPQVDAPPRQFPEVPPPPYGDPVQAGWLAEAMMQMQHTVGRLEATSNHLVGESSRQGAKLDRISHIIFGAGAVLTVVLAIAAFVLDKIWDGLILLLKASH